MAERGKIQMVSELEVLQHIQRVCEQSQLLLALSSLSFQPLIICDQILILILDIQLFTIQKNIHIYIICIYRQFNNQKYWAMPSKTQKSPILDSPFARKSIQQHSNSNNQEYSGQKSGSESDIEPDQPSSHQQQQQQQDDELQSQQQSNRYQRQVSQQIQQFNRKQNKNKGKLKIDYSLDVGQYLNKVGKSNNNQQSDQKSISLQSKQDQQIKHIIGEILNKRKKNSRVSNFSDYGSQADNKISNMLHINQVNKRIESQNLQLSRNIKNLLNKIKSLNVKRNNNSINSNQTSLIEKRKQLSKLKKRIARAQQTNAKMSLQLSKLYESRKSKTKQKNTSPHKPQTIPNSFNTRQAPTTATHYNNNNAKLVTQTGGKLKSPYSHSPMKLNYYSPIMQFQQYNINNQPTISIYNNDDRSLHKTSQFGVGTTSTKQVINMEIQTDIIGSVILKEEEELDRIILEMEAKVRNYNGVITKYQQILIKQIL